MEENMDVSMAQEFVEPETASVPDAVAEEPVSEETEKEIPNEPESNMEETVIPETVKEVAPAEVDGNQIQEPLPPEIDAQVYAGWQELAKAHPEVVGKPLPDDIMKACVESGLPPLRVYESMMLKKQGEQIEALRQEIATLRQNADAAERAPVTAASLGGNEGNDPNDEFMRGFNS